jgi:hypothetical protein
LELVDNMPSLYEIIAAQRGFGGNRVMPISGLPAGGLSLGVNPIQAAPQMMAPMGSGVPEDPDRFAQLRQRFGLRNPAEIRAEMEAAQNAPLPDEMKELFRRREELLARQEGQLRERPSLGETLVNIGTAMARTRSPFFGAGLSEGLAANLAAQKAQRAEFLRQRSTIDQAREQAALDQMRELRAVRSDALARAKALADAENISLSQAASLLGLDIKEIERGALPGKLQREEKAGNLSIETAEENLRQNRLSFPSEQAFRQAQIENLYDTIRQRREISSSAPSEAKDRATSARDVRSAMADFNSALANWKEIEGDEGEKFNDPKGYAKAQREYLTQLERLRTLNESHGARFGEYLVKGTVSGKPFTREVQTGSAAAVRPVSNPPRRIRWDPKKNDFAG